MKTIKLLVSVAAAGFLISLPLVYANNAPVEDLSAESLQPYNAAPVSAINSSDAQYNNQRQRQRLRYQEQISNLSPQTARSRSHQIQMLTTIEPVMNSNADTSNMTASNKGRLRRLEQEMSNMTNMNLSQQVEELRLEVQQLNGRVQVQQHSIQVLGDQQRSFYQDLNRRIQQIGNSGGISMTQKQQKQKQKQAPTKPMAAKAKLKDSGVYRSAFNLLVKKKYDDALAAFQGYISQYPNGTSVANAYYWVGELYLKKNDTKMAAQSFSHVISQYPSSNKVPDAKLKLAVIHISQGKTAQARRELQSIKQRYPNSTAAQLASIQLQRMAQ